MDDLTHEHWLPVPGYEGLYDVSDLGRIWSHYCKRVLKPGLRGRRGRKYPFVVLHKNGKRQNAYVHTLVLLAFRGERPEGCLGRHLDDVSTNNVLSNLVWGTDSQNKADAVINDRHGESKRTRCDQGHEWTEANTRWYRGYRCCRQCKRENEAARRADPVIRARVRKQRRERRAAA